MKQKTVKPVGYIHTDFKEKFGIPRQSGRSPSSTGEIIFYPPYCDKDAFREIESFSHLWVLFDFSAVEQKEFCPLVRPPRLGGNTKVGVFASRSPFRPNGIGLSCVKLERVNCSEKGVSLIVSGVDLLDGTPILDVKPYIPSADCQVGAKGGYADGVKDYKVEVVFPTQLQAKIPADKLPALIECLSDDPRPSYQADGREYGMNFADKNVKFTVENGVLTVTNIE